MKELKIQYNFLQNRHCLAVKENEEGRVTRETSCKNSLKDFCCYLCDGRESCDVSCDYLRDTKRFTNYKETIDKKSQSVQVPLKDCLSYLLRGGLAKNLTLPLLQHWRKR